MSNAKSESKKIWLITGVSRGLEKALAQAVLDQGDIVIGTTRSGKADIEGDSDQLKILGLELTDTTQISQTVEAAYQSEDNRWVNAQRIEVSGGQFL